MDSQDRATSGGVWFSPDGTGPARPDFATPDLPGPPWLAPAPPGARLLARLRARPQATAIGAPPPDRDEGLLERLIGRHISPELLGLWLVEVSLCAVLFYALLTAGTQDGGGDAGWPGPGLRNINRAVALALTFGFTSAAVGLYSPDTYLRTRGLLINTAVGVLLASPAIWAVGRAAGIDLPGGFSVRAAEELLAGTFVLAGLRLAFGYALRRDMFIRRVLIVGSDPGAARLQAAIASVRGGFFKVVDVLPPDETIDLTPAALRQLKVWAVIVTAAASDTLPARQILRARERGARIYTDADFWERRLRRIDVDQPGADWRQADARAAGAAPRAAQPGGSAAASRILGRAGDILLSLTLLLFTLPLMLVTAAAIACESRGPVLYRQERVGLHGRPFTLLKFRSMRKDAEARGPVWATARDPRVTRIGAFIRLTRIDELPQLLCVLRGQMSFIGPRPERQHFVEQLEQVLPFYSDRLLVKPGLTGWAQVNYPYGASVEDARAKLSYDLYYVKNRGLLLDLLILLATVRVVLFQRGAR